MFSAPTPSTRSARGRPEPSGGRAVHLRVVDTDVYADWESVYRDNVDRLYRLMYARVGKNRAARLLAALPDRCRRILELRFLEASSIKEAARAMDISVTNANVLQHRALRMATKVGMELDQ